MGRDSSNHAQRRFGSSTRARDDAILILFDFDATRPTRETATRDGDGTVTGR